MTITVDCRPGMVRDALVEHGIDPIECEWDDDAGVTVVCVLGQDGDRLKLSLKARGLRFWRGRPRAAYSDPTFAAAAQRIMRRERGAR